MMKATNNATKSLSIDCVDVAYYSMLDKLLQEMSVKEIIEFLADYMQTTVVLYTVNGSHIFSSSDHTDIKKHFPELLSMLNSPQRFQEFLASTQTGHVPTEYTGIYLDYYGKANPTAVSADLVFEGSSIGTLFCLCIDPNSLEEEKRILSSLSTIIATQAYPEICRSAGKKNAELDTIADVNQGAKWLSKINGTEYHNFYILVADVGENGSDRIPQLIQIFNQNHFLYRQVANDGNHTFIFNIKNYESVPHLHEIVNHYSKDNGIYLGLSLRFYSTEYIRTAYLQALDAIHIAKVLGLECSLCDFNRLGTVALLYELNNTTVLECYRSTRIEKLCQYDKKNATNLYSTLQTYISTGGSISKTSNLLFLHRNTLSYRLDRIEQELELSLKNPETQAQLWFEMSIKQVLDASLA